METIKRLITAIEKLLPEYLANPDDKNIGDGNVAVCIIDEENNVCGKLFGTDKNIAREFFRMAWVKASQVWITGYKTEEFETLVYTKQINEEEFGIMRPDYIGWEGGQPVVLKDGTKLSVGFAGFRGPSDSQIVTKAIASLE